ncbi:MAG TPA: hypothetical protein PK385_09475 [Spirochaetota bacterium]|nr:hypothetical protein [Spirochaetota bacterium]HOS33210.1 hypothetical protein [Spirochaetota bacterium]HOS56275.1 hypothetical protein [Spirochaetota bacterium]HPK61691.1 hypothetical protein [Spirochaetota bacterium]HQF77489.1 hypothetical protein [Spirochaetota bacterium]
MALITIDKEELKDLVKDKLAELLKSRSDLLEIIEDLALGKLMEEGDKGDLVSEGTIFSTLGIKK